MSNLLFHPQAIRKASQHIFEETKKGNTHFHYHPEHFTQTVDFVMEVIRHQYPDLKVPFHSRWQHFKAGNVDRNLWLKARLKNQDSLEIARMKWDLVIPSVLLDAGAGEKWKFYEKETSREYQRSEGLGLASFHLFLDKKLSRNGEEFKTEKEGLEKLTLEKLKEAFQVTDRNPLIGLEGRLLLLHQLAKALENKHYFIGPRPGHLVDFLLKEHGNKIEASQILCLIIESLGEIWPGRMMIDGINLGDVWSHSKFGLVPFHKLSQWMTYSLIEPLREAGIEVSGVEELTGLPEYRNGGLFIDLGLLSAKDKKIYEEFWAPGDDVIIEWRALTVHLLDLVATEVQKRLGQGPQEFPLAKVLEGGTWAAGRKLAFQYRTGGVPPIQIKSDGTVF